MTAEMLIHDTMDDETTLAEEEALQTQEENEAELDELQEVSCNNINSCGFFFYPI